MLQSSNCGGNQKWLEMTTWHIFRKVQIWPAASVWPPDDVDAMAPVVPRTGQLPEQPKSSTESVLSTIVRACCTSRQHMHHSACMYSMYSMYLCIYVSMYLCIYVSMYLCIYVCMYVRMNVCLFVWFCWYVMHVCPSVRVHARPHGGREGGREGAEGGTYIAMFVNTYRIQMHAISQSVRKKRQKTFFPTWKHRRFLTCLIEETGCLPRGVDVKTIRKVWRPQLNPHPRRLCVALGAKVLQHQLEEPQKSCRVNSGKARIPRDRKRCLQKRSFTLSWLNPLRTLLVELTSLELRKNSWHVRPQEILYHVGNRFTRRLASRYKLIW